LDIYHVVESEETRRRWLTELPANVCHHINNIYYVTSDDSSSVRLLFAPLCHEKASCVLTLMSTKAEL